MTKLEALSEITKFHTKKEVAYRKLLAAANAVIPALMDAKLEHTARPLKEAVFELEVIEQELAAAFRKDPEVFLDVISDGLRGAH